jgi:hypothetical protein
MATVYDPGWVPPTSDPSVGVFEIWVSIRWPKGAVARARPFRRRPVVGPLLFRGGSVPDSLRAPCHGSLLTLGIQGCTLASGPIEFLQWPDDYSPFGTIR